MSEETKARWLSRVLEELAAKGWDVTLLTQPGSPFGSMDASEWTRERVVKAASECPIAAIRFQKDDLTAGLLWMWDHDADEIASGTTEHGFIEDLTAAQIAAGMIED